METTQFVASELLDTSVRRTAYLTAALETGDSEEIRDALGIVALSHRLGRARSGAETWHDPRAHKKRE